MPVLTIIAGPNGAGKSTYSKALLSDFGIEAFDLDKEFYKIWAEFSFDPFIESAAFERAQKLYTDRRAQALKKKRNFSFETNFHTLEILDVLEMFRSIKYNIELIFICLENPEIAIERVKDRVAKGGHAVSEQMIRKRFADGLKLLDENFDKFDLISIYLSKQNEVQPIGILEPGKNKVSSLSPIPGPLASDLPKLVEFIGLNMA